MENENKKLVFRIFDEYIKEVITAFHHSDLVIQNTNSNEYFHSHVFPLATYWKQSIFLSFSACFLEIASFMDDMTITGEDSLLCLFYFTCKDVFPHTPDTLGHKNATVFLN